MGKATKRLLSRLQKANEAREYERSARPPKMYVYGHTCGNLAGDRVSDEELARNVEPGDDDGWILVELTEDEAMRYAKYGVQPGEGGYPAFARKVARTIRTYLGKD